MERKIITTNDGSHSIYVPELNEHYHSVHGALNESMHVFIRNGLHYFIGKKKNISILEVGMGTGLNVFLTAIEMQKSKDLNVFYCGVEAYPLKKEIIDQLNYIGELKQERQLFDKIHSSDWDKSVQMADNLSLHKIHSGIQDAKLDMTFDLVYFDAFAPEKQPEMWTDEVFSKIYDSMNTGAILVTYCAKGEFKRTLKRCGFEVQPLAGPPGKREMVRAVKI